MGPYSFCSFVGRKIIAWHYQSLPKSLQVVSKFNQHSKFSRYRAKTKLDLIFFLLNQAYFFRAVRNRTDPPQFFCNGEPLISIRPGDFSLCYAICFYFWLIFNLFFGILLTAQLHGRFNILPFLITLAHFFLPMESINILGEAFQEYPGKLILCGIRI